MSRFPSTRAAALSALLLMASVSTLVAADGSAGPPPGAGPVGGSYVLGEEEDVEVGQLDACTWETMLLITCRWTDRHGVGFARLLFSSDFRAFRGFWGNTLDALTLPWEGGRE